MPISPSSNEPRDHHYAPQFYLRNFACDPEQKKINAVMKHGQRAVWAQRSIEGIGYEDELYVHMSGGRPVSVERAINRKIETPISQTDTWKKITSGRTDALDRSDKPILYALVRHLEVRTPHALQTQRELIELATSPHSEMEFSDQEREMYAELKANPELARQMFNRMSSTMGWTEKSYRGAGLSIWRSPIPLRSSTTPVMSIPVPPHPALRLPLPGMMPYQLVLTINKTTAVALVIADFDDAFSNIEIDVQVARGLNRNRVGHFAQFSHVTHLITERDDLIEDITWAPYLLVEETERRISFQRDPSR
jgi:hypothetical protein